MQDKILAIGKVLEEEYTAHSPEADDLTKRAQKFPWKVWGMRQTMKGRPLTKDEIVATWLELQEFMDKGFVWVLNEMERKKYRNVQEFLLAFRSIPYETIQMLSLFHIEDNIEEVARIREFCGKTYNNMQMQVILLAAHMKPK